MTRHWMSILVIIVSLLPAAQLAFSQCEISSFVASDGADGDRFGFAQDVRGQLAVVGAPAADLGASSTGAAYVYRRDALVWTEEQKLSASNPAASDEFGFAVGIIGELNVVIGAPDTNNFTGCCYVFAYQGGVWSETQIITASDAAERDLFGSFIAADGNIVLIGAPGVGGPEGDPNVPTGAAYIMAREGQVLVEKQKLVASDGLPGDHFGYSVCLIENWAFCGAYQNDGQGTNSGLVYVFRFDGDTWSETQKLIPFDGHDHTNFGFSLGCDGQVLVVGALGAPTETGFGYVYRRAVDTWIFETKLSPSDGRMADQFGLSAAVEGQTILLGSETDQGSVYRYEYGSPDWEETAKIVASDGVIGDTFGASIALEAGEALIGAQFANNGNGAVYSIAVSGEDCNGDATLDLCEVLSGSGADCNDNLEPDECDIDSGLSTDCNMNGIPDECDINGGTSPDFDQNGIPDECDGCASVQSLMCVSEGDNVVLSWSNEGAYVDIVIRRDSEVVATLAGESLTFSDVDVSPGTYEYSVQGQCDFGASERTYCFVAHPPGGPFIVLSCDDDPDAPGLWILTQDLVAIGDCLEILSDDVILDGNGHTIIGSFAPLSKGITAVGRNRVTVQNCVVRNFVRGIKFEETNDSKILDSEASFNSLIGIQLLRGHDNSISNVETSSNDGWGILSAASDRNALSSILADSNNVGIELGSSDSCVLDNVTATNNDDGVVFSSGAAGSDMVETTLVQSLVENNASAGIRFTESGGEVTGTTIERSIIRGNGVGILIKEGPTGNSVFDNIFDNVGLNAVDNSGGLNEWNADLIQGPNIIGGPFIGGNYWNDYLGLDTDGDGIGDTDLPYDAGGSIQVGGDSLPLVEPRPEPAYIRGDCNNNGVFDGLGDGLEALNYQFVFGFPEPSCLAACDANHSKTFGGLPDGLMILNAQFLPGAPVPDPPWPSCGTEGQDTVMALECAEPACP